MHITNNELNVAKFDRVDWVDRVENQVGSNWWQVGIVGSHIDRFWLKIIM